MEKAKEKKKFSIKPYLKKNKWGIFAYILLIIIEIGINIPFAILPANMIVAITESKYQLALKYVAILGVIYVITTIYVYLSPKLFARLSTSITIAMSLDIAEQSFKISSAAYSNHQTGNFLQRIRSDPDKIFNCITAIVESIGSLISTGVIIAYILTLNPWISLVIATYLILITIITYFRKKTRIKNQKKNRKSNEKITSLLNEIVRSERDIKSLNLEDELKKQTCQKFDEHKKIVLKTNNDSVIYRVLDYTTFTIFIVIFYILGIKLLDKGLLTLANFLILHNNRNSMDILSRKITDVINNVADIKVAYERINELYEDKDYDLEKFGDVHIDNIKNDIEFKNVGFSYVEYKNFTQEEILQKQKYNKKHKIKDPIPKREKVGEKQVFDDLSFKIKPNSTVAFVGKSGCGKSTILNLISKIYTVDKGEVLIGGHNINSLDKETLRSSISLVNQFPYIFDMTIKENLLLAKPDATDEELQNAIKDSALDEFIKDLSLGIDTKVGESGMKLSGGQKQRLAIARALLKNSKVIILDESTSSLDNISQNTIKESIDLLKGKSTIIIVAHRLSTIKNVDEIFYMENGKIVDAGTFDDLMKRNKSFKTIYNAEDIQ